MEALTPGQSKPLLLKYLLPYFEQNGFALKKNNGAQSFFYKNNKLGKDEVMFTPEDYYPVIYYVYHFSKKIKIIQDIAAMIGKKVQLNPPIISDTNCIAFAPKKEDGLAFKRMPECRNEADIKVNAGMIIDYSENIALPLLERMNDLRELDNEINGESPWPFDFGNPSLPFRMGGNFHVKRLIVAKLTGRKNIDELIDIMNTKLRQSALEDNLPIDEYVSDAKDSLDATLEVLKNIKPLIFD